MTSIRAGVRLVPYYIIEVDYIPTEDHFVLMPFSKGHLVWKPF